MQTLPKQIQEPAELFHANVVFGHASRGLDHAAIQGVSNAQLHEPQGGRGGQEGKSAREIKTEGGETRQRKRHSKLKKTYPRFNVVFQQSQANFQRTISPTPPKYRQNVPQILPNDTQEAPKVTLLETLGRLLSPSSPKVTKAGQKGFPRQPKGARRDPQNQEICIKNYNKRSLESGPAKVDEQVLTRYLPNFKK